MANILVNTGFLVGSESPIDGKAKVQTLADRDQLVTDGLAYESLRTYVVDEKKWYEYDGTDWKEATGSVTTTDLIEKDNTGAVSSKGVYGALYVTVPEVPQHYEQTSVGELGALEIVADGTVTDSSTQIAISDVTPLKDGETWNPSIGEYAVLIALVPESEEEKYAKNSDVYDKATVDEKITEIASGGLKPMSEAEFDTFWGGLTITASGYVDPSQP